MKMKGQALELGAVPTVILTLTLVGFYLTFGALIMTEQQSAAFDLGTVQTNNESMGTVVTNVAETITGSGLNPRSYSVIEVMNSTQFKLQASSYTFASGSGSATFTLTNVSHNNTVLRITYTNEFDVETYASNASQYTNQALDNISSRLPLLALVIFFAIILSLIAILAATGRISV